MTRHKIAVIPGDGIGKEVIPEGIKMVETAAKLFGVTFEWVEFDWSCERYHKEGAMMPADGIEQLAKFDAIYLGAVGYPGVPDHISLWGLLLPIRRRFDQYVSLRPVRLFEGVASPLANINPEGKFPSMFEPVHGSAPDIAGLGIANPIGAIWSAAMMVQHLGYEEIHNVMMNAIEGTLRDGKTLTKDMGGNANMSEMMAAILGKLG